MSFQAYLDTIEKKTGLTPRQLLEIAREKGLGQEGVKAAEILDWLKEDYQLGRATAWRWSMSSRRDRTSPANTSDPAACTMTTQLFYGWTASQPSLRTEFAKGKAARAPARLPRSARLFVGLVLHW